MEAAGTSFLSGVFALISLRMLMPFAVKFRLLDKPNQRKAHKGAVPLIGGLSAFVGVCLGFMLVMPLNTGYVIFLLCASVLVVLGAIDDARDISAKFRLFAQVVLGALLVYGSGDSLESFGDLVGLGVIELGVLGPLVSIAAVIGATNAFNMIDGIDGLAGSLSLIALLSLALLFSFSPGHEAGLALAAGLSCALLPYMMANLRIPPFKRRIFMGDAGSMFIGFAIVWLMIQGAPLEGAAFRPVTALWIIAIPLIDMVAIMVRRARKGQSVMRPDREHLHHIFMRAGFSDREALVFITAVAMAFAGFGLLGEFLQIPEWVMFVAFAVVFALYDYALSNVWRLLAVFRRSRAVKSSSKLKVES
ncbi:UDP-N-acetylglucosamine--undecaprenyl-phosphate N-acetylglucosaminephosphotransferase [Alcanivorax sp. S6407]|uniref:UDP-N-acetylglucosamine--undecaprenyl-phosphate N-acetylglucosaminephosphotransferase n=1 Tax=Alcanivorax sp. S6407 TaxID=2926424 RepID=UPI001FF6107B|nr:UDP-N-acetylglucosamine--undecaprenyl-phosphate N-acetylglucosaminephosphotransferase [Alcanivorax sp. S6407]MCK0152829.1 UDP-N-acetylglucosamine--undecaprenyl-phosphate N-acetylglucosaminephosphotransferase [Alcanivorax sp. S6407]